MEDLKRVLHKDINKRMCETYAFLMFDRWWEEQKEKHDKVNVRKTSTIF